MTWMGDGSISPGNNSYSHTIEEKMAFFVNACQLYIGIYKYTYKEKITGEEWFAA